MSSIEWHVLILVKEIKEKEDAVNDIMSGIIVSDSESIDIDNLVLCKKIDGSVRGMIIL